MVQSALQRWIHLTKYKRRMRPLAVDHVLMWGVACVLCVEVGRPDVPEVVRNARKGGKKQKSGLIPSDRDSEDEANGRHAD